MIAGNPAIIKALTTFCVSAIFEAAQLGLAPLAMVQTERRYPG